jgi:Cd2+/Zn2+-exporting ATPase
VNTQTLQLPLILPSKPDCDRCVVRLQEELRQIKGVEEASIDSAASTINLSYDPNIVTLSRIETEARQAGAALAARIDHQTLELRDLDCPDCAASIEKAVNQIPGVLWAGANFAAGQLYAEFERGAVGITEIARTVEMHGVRACSVNGADTSGSVARPGGRFGEWWAANRRMAGTVLSTALTIAGAALSSLHLPSASIGTYAAAVVVGGWSISRGAWMSARSRAIDMNVLMTLAVAGACGIGEWFEAATVVALYNIGAQLQAYTIDRTRRSIRALINLSPKRATVLRDNATEVRVEDVRVGDIVMVKPGERIPLDGKVISGKSIVNEAPITGESVPVDKASGDVVFAGSLNGNGAIEFRATHAYKDTTLARIIHRVEEAQAQRAPTQQYIDRFAAKYTPVVVCLAVAIAIVPPLVALAFPNAQHLTPNAPWPFWFHRALSLLIIACPCALVISTPVAFVTAIGSASRKGVLIKGGAFLEQVGRLKALLYDKTGTLTQGKFELQEVIPLNGMASDSILEIAASMEARSEHPLASAIVEEARSRHLNFPHAEEFEAMPGLGARAKVGGVRYVIGSPRYLDSAKINLNGAAEKISELESAGKSAVVLSSDREAVGVLTLADAARAHVSQTVSEIAEMGIRGQAIMSGDNEYVTRAIAAVAGIQDFHAGLLPEQKLALVADYRGKFGPVGMIGDGINDAPALAAADVGIAMGAAASETAIETADIALLGDNLSRLPWLIRLGRRTNGIVRQNVAFSLATKGALLIAAAFIGMPLWLAVLGDVGVSLIVTMNALRLMSNGSPV